MQTSFNSPINWNAVGKNAPLSPEVRTHVRKVYTTLAVTLVSATVGCVADLYYNLSGLLAIIGLFALIFMFAGTPNQPETMSKRFAILQGIGFLKGVMVGPLVMYAAYIDPAIISTAFLGSACIFACFSAAALLAERRSMLYLGGMLGSALTLLAITSLVNIFIGSVFLFDITVYLGLLVFCGFVMFDTQLMIERASMGNKDYMHDALQLFIDFVAIFVRLLIILSRNKGRKKSSSNGRR